MTEAYLLNQYASHVEGIVNYKVRWTRAVSWGIGIFVVGLGIALLPVAWRAYSDYRDNIVAPIVASPDEFQSILVALLDKSVFDGEPPPPPNPGDAPRTIERKPLVLVDETVVICDDKADVKSSCSVGEDASSFLFPGSEMKIALQLRRELVAANPTAVRFACPTSRWAACSRPETVSTIFAKGGWWRDFYAKFPDTAGFMHVSNAVLSHDGQSALIYVAYGCGGLCGEGTLVLLNRAGSGWIVVREEQLWIA